MKDALEHDAFQNLLEMEYQRRQRHARTHYHECHGCEVQLVCCCPDRRQVDRLTGKMRVFWCIPCGMFHEAAKVGAFDEVT